MKMRQVLKEIMNENSPEIEKNYMSSQIDMPHYDASRL